MTTPPHPDERLYHDELEDPCLEPEFYERLAHALPEREALIDLLALRELHLKRTFAIRAERAWFRHFGWRVIRPFMLVAVAAGVFFAFGQRTIDPTLGAMIFLGGAGTLYVVIQVFAMFWGQRNQKRLPELDAAYRERLRRRLDEWRTQSGERERGTSGP